MEQNLLAICKCLELNEVYFQFEELVIRHDTRTIDQMKSMFY